MRKSKRQKRKKQKSKTPPKRKATKKGLEKEMLNLKCFQDRGILDVESFHNPGDNRDRFGQSRSMDTFHRRDDVREDLADKDIDTLPGLKQFRNQSNFQSFSGAALGTFYNLDHNFDPTSMQSGPRQYQNHMDLMGYDRNPNIFPYPNNDRQDFPFPTMPMSASFSNRMPPPEEFGGEARFPSIFPLPHFERNRHMQREEERALELDTEFHIAQVTPTHFEKKGKDFILTHVVYSVIHLQPYEVESYAKCGYRGLKNSLAKERPDTEAIWLMHMAIWHKSGGTTNLYVCESQNALESLQKEAKNLNTPKYVSFHSSLPGVITCVTLFDETSNTDYLISTCESSITKLD